MATCRGGVGVGAKVMGNEGASSPVTWHSMEQGEGGDMARLRGEGAVDVLRSRGPHVTLLRCVREVPETRRWGSERAGERGAGISS